jgi:hypothetical protein
MTHLFPNTSRSRLAELPKDVKVRMAVGGSRDVMLDFSGVEGAVTGTATLARTLGKPVYWQSQNASNYFPGISGVAHAHGKRVNATSMYLPSRAIGLRHQALSTTAIHHPYPDESGKCRALPWLSAYG